MFHAGQFVECIATRPGSWVDTDDVTPVPGPKNFEVCTVSSWDGTHLRLVEYRGPRCFYEIEWQGRPLFRPLSDSRIAIFRKLFAPDFDFA